MSISLYKLNTHVYGVLQTINECVLKWNEWNIDYIIFNFYEENFPKKHAMKLDYIFNFTCSAVHYHD